jgi:hypothetical protein
MTPTTPCARRTALALWIAAACTATLEAQTVQLRANANDERWGDRASATSRGKVLWFERDAATNSDDVYLFDGSAIARVQAGGGLTNVDAPVFALGTGATPSSVIALWRRDTDFAWMSVDGGTPVLVSATNPGDPTKPLNPEGAAIADGCVFVVLQDLSGDFARKHVFRVDPATAIATLLTDPGTFPITGAAVGAPRVTTSGCRAAWRFFDGTGPTPAASKLHFYDGAAVSVVDQGEIGLPHLSRGRVVYTKVVDGIGQVFVYDGTAESPAPVQLTSDSDPTRTNSHAKTDGRHVAWLRETTNGHQRHIVLNGGLQLTTAATKPADGAVSADFPIQLDRGQMLWKDAGGALRYLTKAGLSTVPIAPALSAVNPWLADGRVAFTGTSADGGADAEPFRFTGTAPEDEEQPAPPLVVRATPGDGRVAVTWDRVLGASGYVLYLAREPGVTRDNYLSKLGGTRLAGVTPPHTVSGLANGTTYYFVVTAVEAGAEGGTSGEASAAARAPLCVRAGGGAPCLGTLSVALASALPGDTVRVAAGTYTGYVVIDKSVTVEGGWNATFTARDPAANPTTLRPPDASFSIVSIEGEAADPEGVAPVLDGFTITGGGGGNHGGGLRVWHSNAVLRNNVIRNNTGFLLGGGVWAVGGAPRFEGNRIEDNVCDGRGQPAYGGGVHLSGTQAALVGNVIAYNRIVGATDARGGGLSAEGGSVTLEGNQFLGNAIPETPAVAGLGGGVFLSQATATLTGNLVRDNVASAGSGAASTGARGGGLALEAAMATLTANVIEGNTATTAAGDQGSQAFGGGAYVSASSVTLSGNVIAGNALAARPESYYPGSGHGGGLSLWTTTAALDGNVIRDNVANRHAAAFCSGDGGGIHAVEGSLTMRGDRVLDNRIGGSCTGTGGGVLASTTPLVLDRVQVQGNAASHAGGLALFGEFTLSSSLVAGNEASATESMGGLYAGMSGYDGKTSRVVNSSFVGNTGTAIWFGCSAPCDATLEVANTLIAGHAIGLRAPTAPIAADRDLFWNNVANATFPLGGSHLVADPLLDENGVPRRGSPAIDAGRNDAVPSGLTQDLAGNPRFADDILAPDTGAGTAPVVDIGAYEFAAGTDLIFADGFESGDLSAWSAAATGGGDLTVSPSAALAATRQGLQGVVDDTAGLFVQDDAPLDEHRYRARFYFDPNGFDPGEALGHLRTRIFVAFEEGPTRRLMALVLRRRDGQYALMGRARRDDGAQADTGFFDITDAPHLLEIEWRRATTPSSNDGELRLWVDGTIRASLGGIANHGAAVDFARLGALSVKAGAAGTLRWDEFESRRASYIGPAPTLRRIPDQTLSLP